MNQFINLLTLLLACYAEMNCNELIILVFILHIKVNINVNSLMDIINKK